MSLLMVCKNKNGIVLAADGKGIDFDPAGNLLTLDVEHLIQLSQYTAILAGGAAEAANLAHALRGFVAEEGLEDIEEVYGAALPFLASGYDRFMRKRCEILPVDPVQHLHFILAGWTGKDPSNPFRLYLVWTKKKLPQLDGDEIGSAFTIPRILRLEYKLNHLSKSDAPLEEVLDEMRQGMEKQAANLEDFGAPFFYAVITAEGFKPV